MAGAGKYTHTHRHTPQYVCVTSYTRKQYALSLCVCRCWSMEGAGRCVNSAHIIYYTCAENAGKYIRQ